MPVAAAIRSGEMKGVEWPRKKVEEGDWTPVRFFSPRLAEKIVRWFKGGKLGLRPLGEIARMGPVGWHVSMDCLLPHEHPRESERPGLWYNNQTGPAKNGAPPKKTMRVETDSYIHPRPGKEKETSGHWVKRGRLHLPYATRTTVLHLSAVVTEEGAIGSGWTPFVPRNPAPGWEEAMCVYLNSTVGVIAALWRGRPVTLDRPKMLTEAMNSVPVPDLTEEQAAALAAVYEEHKDAPLQRFRDQKDDPVRRALDAAVCETMGWDLEEVASVRRALAEEPSFIGRRAPS